MASRKEQKEALRQERLAREQAAAQSAARKRLIGIVVAAILALGIVGAVAAVLLGGGDDGGASGGGGGATVSYPDGGEIPPQAEADLAAALEAAGCKDETVKTPFPPDGWHTTDPAKLQWDSEPPAMGAHEPDWPDDDIYEESPPIGQVVHTLEHGRILVWLNPTLTDDELAQFKALYEEDPYHVIMLPREELKEPFAVSAWEHPPRAEESGHILRCEAVDDSTWDAIRAFKETYRDKGPEFVP